MKSTKEHDLFLKRLMDVEEKRKREAYATLLHRFLIKVRSSGFNQAELSLMADIIHNIPLYLTKTEEIQDEMIWSGWEKSYQYFVDYLKRELLEILDESDKGLK